MKRRPFLLAAVAPVTAAIAESIQPAKSLNLKITGIKTFVVNAGSVNWVYCKIYTNQGLVGLAEGSVTSKEATASQATLQHERFLVAQDPSDIHLRCPGMLPCRHGPAGPVP